MLLLNQLWSYCELAASTTHQMERVYSVLFVCIDFNAVNVRACACVIWMAVISQHTISSSDKRPVCACVLLALCDR